MKETITYIIEKTFHPEQKIWVECHMLGEYKDLAEAQKDARCLSSTPGADSAITGARVIEQRTISTIHTEYIKYGSSI